MEITDLPQDKIIILFDGVCNLCDSLVHYIIKHDKKDIFRLDSLQSKNGIKILKHIGIDPKKFDSIIVFFPDGKYLEKSDAALEIGKHLGWRFTASVLKFVPKVIRNPVYDFIAKNRYKWYGKKDQCLLPTPEIKSKFL